MLYDFPVPVQAKNVYAGPVGIARPLLPRVKNHVISFREYPHEMDALAGVLLRHTLEVANKPLLTVFYHWIVLNVGIANMPFDSCGGAALVEHQVVESLNRFLILLKVHGVAPVRLRSNKSESDFILRVNDMPLIVKDQPVLNSGWVEFRGDHTYLSETLADPFGVGYGAAGTWTRPAQA